MKDCKESVLSGFTPSKEVQDKWAQMLENNGIVKGVECRLIGGQDEGKITTFGGVENCLINDLGISVGNGYFLLENKGELKVSKPLYRMVEGWNIGLYGALLNGVKVLISKNAYGSSRLEIELELGFKAIKCTNVDNGVLYEFESERDIFEWLSKI